MAHVVTHVTQHLIAHLRWVDRKASPSPKDARRDPSVISGAARGVSHAALADVTHLAHTISLWDSMACDSPALHREGSVA